MKQTPKNQIFLDKFKSKCYYCQVKLSLNNATRDHYIPKCKGGKRTDGNIVLACKNCNFTKQDHDAEKFICYISMFTDELFLFSAWLIVLAKKKSEDYYLNVCFVRYLTAKNVAFWFMAVKYMGLQFILAEECFHWYDFGETIKYSAWNHREGSNIWERPIYFPNGEQRTFIVRFEDDEVTEAYIK